MTNLESGFENRQDKEEQIRQTEELRGEYEEKIKEELTNVAKKVGENVSEKQMLPKDAMGFDDATIEAIYSHGYRLYNAEKFNEAFTVFRMLMLLNPVEKKYLFGLAACLHRMKEYEDAVKAYLLNAIYDSKNPVIYFHVADCYARLGVLPLAQNALEDVVRLSADQPSFKVLKERALLMLEGIKNGTFTASSEPQDTRRWGHGDDDVDRDDED